MIKYHKSNRLYDSLINKTKYGDTFQLESNCHWGQRKLLLSEIEFFTVVKKFLNLSECIMVYVGAAPGDHTPYLLKLFPELSCILYDPRDVWNSQLRSNPKVTIMTGDKGYFTDDSIEEARQLIGDKKCLFLCDMRVETAESMIWEDMKSQQRWGVLLKAEFMFLKFRLPYVLPTDKMDNTIFTYTLDHDVKKKIVNSDKTNTFSENSVEYLYGDIYIQLYASSRSTETRLFVPKIKYISESHRKNFDIVDKKYDEKYYMKSYNYYDYEDKLNHFNTQDRINLEFKYKQSDDMINHIIGYNNTYDCVSEYFVIYQYIESLKKDSDIHKDTVKLINDMTIFLNKESKGNSLLTCKLQQELRRVLYYDEITNEVISSNSANKEENEKKIKERKNKIDEFFCDQINNIEKHLKKQDITKSRILTKEEVNKQIKSNDNKVIKGGDNILFFVRNGKLIPFKKGINNITSKFCPTKKLKNN